MMKRLKRAVEDGKKIDAQEGAAPAQANATNATSSHSLMNINFSRRFIPNLPSPRQNEVLAASSRNTETRTCPAVQPRFLRSQPQIQERKLLSVTMQEMLKELGELSETNLPAGIDANLPKPITEIQQKDPESKQFIRPETPLPTRNKISFASAEPPNAPLVRPITAPKLKRAQKAVLLGFKLDAGNDMEDVPENDGFTL
jgi:hypothetical protein